jgi:uncharacterized damage-inducible protein DinB
MKAHFAMFALYNRWANRRLYAAAEKLSDADYRSDRGAFFGSMHGTLNHLLVTDQIWIRRFTGEGPAHSTLDAIIHDQFALLHDARAAEDGRIIKFIDGLSDAALDQKFSYTTITSPKTVSQRRAPALAHWFNHQTHHRGQAHMILTSVAGNDAAPSLDLLLFQRETGVGLD